MFNFWYQRNREPGNMLNRPPETISNNHKARLEAPRCKLRQTLALLARGKADADSQAGGKVATVILCA
jgi:hypothetical protein